MSLPSLNVTNDRPPVVFLLLIVTLILCASRPGFSDSGLTRHEQKQVLDQASHILGGNANISIRWQSEVRMALIDAGSEMTADAEQTLAEIAAITGLETQTLTTAFDDAADYLQAVKKSQPYQLTACDRHDPALCASLVVVVTSSDTMLQLARTLPLRSLYIDALERSPDEPCFFSPYQVRAAEIKAALIYINDSLSPQMLSTCLHEEMYQAFGLFGDYSDSDYFSFDNRVVPKVITDYDKALLRAVYRLNPGAPVFAVLKALAADLGFDVL